MHTATLITKSKDAESVAKALSIDNIIDNEKNLLIVTKSRDKRIITNVKATSISTLLNTLDDIIHCQMIAEKVL